MKKTVQTFRILGFLLLGLWGLGANAEPEVRFTTPDGQAVVVGDIHGDFKALIKILSDKSLIDKRGKWIGGDRHLVVDGDFVGKGKQSYETAYFLMNLQKLAKADGGTVHINPGNHELRILQGDTSSLSKRDRALFAEDYAGGAREAFSRGTLGKWFRTTAMVRSIDRAIISHGDPDMRLAEVGLEKGNEWFSNWILFFQGRGEKPPEETRWVVELGNKGGPLGGRQLVKRNLSPKQLGSLLKGLDGDRIIVAHTPTKSNEIETLYGGRVIRVDTGISQAVGGSLSVLTLEQLSEEVRKEQREQLKEKKGRKAAKGKSTPEDLPESAQPEYPGRGSCKAYKRLKPK